MHAMPGVQRLVAVLALCGLATGCGSKLLGRDIHHTKPTPGEDPMFFSIQQIRLFACILQKKPAEFRIIIGHEAAITKCADRQVREHILVDRAFG